MTLYDLLWQSMTCYVYYQALILYQDLYNLLQGLTLLTPSLVVL